MKLKLWTAIAVFLGSYLPLSLILLVQDVSTATGCAKEQQIFKHPYWSVSTFIIVLLCFILSLLLLQQLPASRSLKIIEAKYIPFEMISYTFPYIVSFMSVSYDEGPKIAGFVIFMTIMFIITYRAGRVFVNPMLIVLGWRAYEITYSFAGDTSEHKAFALAKTSDLSIGFVKSAQIEDLLVISGRVGV